MRNSRCFRPSLGGLEPRLALSGAAAEVALPAPSSDPFLDPFAPAPSSPDDGGSSTEPDPNPTAPASDYPGDYPPFVPLPPIPVGPAGPAF